MLNITSSRLNARKSYRLVDLSLLDLQRWQASMSQAADHKAQRPRQHRSQLLIGGAEQPKNNDLFL
jgi:hypothetical protein